MRLSIAFVAAATFVAATLLTGMIGASAQDIEGASVPAKGHSTRHHGHRRSADMTGNESGQLVALPDIPRGSAGGPLPNYFRNCEEPTSPRFCAK